MGIWSSKTAIAWRLAGRLSAWDSQGAITFASLVVFLFPSLIKLSLSRPKSFLGFALLILSPIPLRGDGELAHGRVGAQLLDRVSPLQGDGLGPGWRGPGPAGPRGGSRGTQEPPTRALP